MIIKGAKVYTDEHLQRKKSAQKGKFLQKPVGTEKKWSTAAAAI